VGSGRERSGTEACCGLEDGLGIDLL